MINSKEFLGQLPKNEKMTEFVAHEFKAPINNILSALELLRMKNAASAGGCEHLFMNIETSAYRLLRLAENLCLFIRLGDDTAKPEHVGLNLKKAAKNAIESVNAYAKNHGVSITLEGEELCAYCNHELYDKVLINLLSNSIKSMVGDEGGRIEVRIAKKDGKAEISVTDNGCGIPAERLPKLLDADDESAMCSGFGLKIVKAVTEMYGGRLSAESVVGEGSTFRFEIADLCDREEVLPFSAESDKVVFMRQPPFIF